MKITLSMISHLVTSLFPVGEWLCCPNSTDLYNKVISWRLCRFCRIHLHNLHHNVAKDNLPKFFMYFPVHDVKQDFKRFLGNIGLLDEGALLGLTSISSLDSASLLLVLIELAVDVLVELTKKE